jgi:hypothetical protein
VDVIDIRPFAGDRRMPSAVLTPSVLDAIFSSGRSSIADGFGKSNFILVRLFWEA